MMPVSEVFNMDCMEYMRSVEDKTFDLAIVDPPYYSGPECRQFYGSKVSTTGVARYNYPIAEKWHIPSAEYFDELLRVAKYYIVWGCNYFDYHFAPGRIVWDKCNGKSSFSDCELAATNIFDSVRMFRYMWNGMCQGQSIARGWIMQGNKSMNEQRIHPTQKPVALYVWIMETFAKPGWKILDTHLGSGSSRIAAYGLGLDFTGCEIDPHYYELQQQRFLKDVLGEHLRADSNVKQLSIFDAYI